MRDGQTNRESIVLDVPQVVELERRIAAAGTSLAELMDRAGAAVAQAALELAGVPQRGGDAAAGGNGAGAAAAGAEREALCPEGRGASAWFVVLCGSGNNGGDGWVAARLLAQAGHAVCVVTPRPAAEISAQPARDAAVEAGRVLSALAGERVADGGAKAQACDGDAESQVGAGLASGARILVAPDSEELEAALADADVIVDAILGTGFSGENVRAPYDDWIRAANACRAARIVAADVPSGLSAQTGAAADPCIQADVTVTMIVQKTGLVTPQAAPWCGEVRVAPLAPIDELLVGLEQKSAK